MSCQRSLASKNRKCKNKATNNTSFCQKHQESPVKGSHAPINIEKLTLENTKKGPIIIQTDMPGVGGRVQIALMSLKKGEDIPFEMHKHVTQFVKVEKGGKGKFFIGKGKDIECWEIGEGDSFTISSGFDHRILCVQGTLKMYSIYAKDSTQLKWVH